MLIAFGQSFLPTNKTIEQILLYAISHKDYGYILGLRT
jgi:hypothetical protein